MQRHKGPGGKNPTLSMQLSGQQNTTNNKSNPGIREICNVRRVGWDGLGWDGLGYTSDDGGSFFGLKLYSMVEVYVLQGKSSKVLQNEGWKNQGVFVIFFYLG